MTAAQRQAAWFAVALAAIAIAAPMLAPYAPTVFLDGATMRAQPPSLAHPLGTDPVTRDVLSRLLHGLRTSIGIAALAVGVALSIGTLIGVLAGAASGWGEAVLMRLTDAALAFPRVLVLLLAVALFEPLDPIPLALLIGATGWMNTARLARSETARLLATEHLRGARVLGVPWPRLVRRHLLPGLAPTIIAAGTIAFAAAIPLEAGLSFIGLGVQAPHASLGNIITEARGDLVHRWWLVVFPTVAIVAMVMAATAIAERLAGTETRR